MMKRFFTWLLFAFLFACSESTEIYLTDPQDEPPTVTSNSAFTVTVVSDIVYAQGKSHDSWNSTGFGIQNLTLDAYVPNNNAQRRPAILLIHGGGFISGSKEVGSMVRLAQYYASRGWVAFSINYRLRDDYGTVPTDWFDYITNNVPPTDQAQGMAIYPAHRDAKAALRWLVANADTFNIDTNYITVGGGSAGAVTAITLGITNPEDYRDEIDSNQDETLLTTHLDQTYRVHTIVDFWGSGVGVNGINLIYGHNRYDAQDAPLIVFHGTDDTTVLFSEAQTLRNRYLQTGVPFEFYPLQGIGHAAWSATINGRLMEEVAFDFIVAQQNIVVAD